MYLVDANALLELLYKRDRRRSAATSWIGLRLILDAPKRTVGARLKSFVKLQVLRGAT
jgi:hypothetical protein